MAKKKDGTEKKEKKKRQGGRFAVSKEAKRKLIPPFVMLTAGAVSAILMVILGRYELHGFLGRLFLILLIFYVLGGLLKGVLDFIERQNTPPPEEDEGEVIEKGPEEETTEEEATEEEEPDKEAVEE